MNKFLRYSRLSRIISGWLSDVLSIRSCYAIRYLHFDVATSGGHKFFIMSMWMIWMNESCWQGILGGGTWWILSTCLMWISNWICISFRTSCFDWSKKLQFYLLRGFQICSINHRTFDGAVRTQRPCLEASAAGNQSPFQISFLWHFRKHQALCSCAQYYNNDC